MEDNSFDFGFSFEESDGIPASPPVDSQFKDELLDKISSLENKLEELTTGDTVEGQIGLNLTDGTLHFKKGNGTYVNISEGGGGIANIVEDTTPQLGGNLDVNGNQIVSVSNGDIELTPNGTGRVLLTSDTIEVGEFNTDAIITTAGTSDLILSTNDGTSSGTVRIYDGANGNIAVEPNGTGDILLTADTVIIGDANINANIETNGDANIIVTAKNSTWGNASLTLTPMSETTNGAFDVNAYTTTLGKTSLGAQIIALDTSLYLGGSLSGSGITIGGGVNSNVTLMPAGTGDVQCNGDTLRVGDNNAAATITTWGTGNLTLSTNNGTNSGTILINQGANGNIELAPNGTGDVLLTADTVRVGDAAATATITSNGAGNLVLNTNSGTTSGSITIAQGANANITLEPNGTGDVLLITDNVQIGDANSAATITTNGTGSFTLSTNNGTNSGTILINQGANASIDITPNGTGVLNLKNIEYNEAVFSLGTTSGTITPNVANGNIQTITLNGNLTFSAFTSPVSGQTLTLIISTNGTNRTLTSTMLFAGASKTLSTTNTVDILTVSYIGTTYYASLAKGFA